MQKVGFCYRENSKKEEWRKKGWTLRLLTNGRYSPGVVLHQFLPEPNRRFPRGAFGRQPPALFNCCFETCQKHLAQHASVEVSF